MAKLLEAPPKKRTQLESAKFLIEHGLIEAASKNSVVPVLTDKGLEQVNAIVEKMLQELKTARGIGVTDKDDVARASLKEAIYAGTGGLIPTLVYYYSGALLEDLFEALSDPSDLFKESK